MNNYFSDIESHKIAYGCMGTTNGFYGTQDDRDSIEALSGAYNIGIRYFDTAEMYGDGYSEHLLGKALGSKRSDIKISSKVKPDNMSFDGIIEECDRSLKNLNSDYIDLYMLHWPSRDVPLSESIEALKTLKKQGKIVTYGVSNFGEKDLEDVLNLTDIGTNQVAYHLFFRAIESRVLPECIRNDVPVMCYSSLMHGLLTGKFETLSDFPRNRARTRIFDSRRNELCRHGENGCEEEADLALTKLRDISAGAGIPMGELAVGWLKAQRGVGGILVGTRNAEQSRGLTKYMDITLSGDIVTALTEATDPIKEKLGDNIDMWDFRTR